MTGPGEDAGAEHPDQKDETLPRQLLGRARDPLLQRARRRRLDAGVHRDRAELGFWLAVGLIVTTWYDRKGLYRLAPDLLAYVEQAVDRLLASANRECRCPRRSQLIRDQTL